MSDLDNLLDERDMHQAHAAAAVEALTAIADMAAAIAAKATAATQPWRLDDDNPLPAGRLVCPECLSDELDTVEQLTAAGLTDGITRFANGQVDIDWSGGSDVDWNSQTTVGVSCRSCTWRYVGPDWSTVPTVLVPESDGPAT